MGPRARPRAARHAAARARAPSSAQRSISRGASSTSSAATARTRARSRRIARASRRRVAATVLIAAHGSWEPSPFAGMRARAESGAGGPVRVQGELRCAPTSRPGCCPCSRSTAATAAWSLGDGGQLTLACCVRRDRAARVARGGAGRSAGTAVEALLAALVRGRARARSAARSARAPGSASGRSGPGSAPLWSERGGFAVGNAAGEAHPILGEGISMAMQAPSCSARELEAQRDALLSGARQERIARAYYERDWRRQFRARIRWAALLAELAMRPAARCAAAGAAKRGPRC